MKVYGKAEGELFVSSNINSPFILMELEDKVCVEGSAFKASKGKRSVSDPSFQSQKAPATGATISCSCCVFLVP